MITEDNPFKYSLDHADYEYQTFHGLLVDFETMPAEERTDLILESKLLSCIGQKFPLDQRERDLNLISITNSTNLYGEIDWEGAILFQGYLHTLNYKVIDEVWEEFYHSRQFHPFEQSTKNEVRRWMARNVSNEKKLEYLLQKQDELKIFELKNLSVEFDIQTNQVHCEYLKQTVIANFDGAKIFNYLVGDIGGYFYVDNEYERLVSDDIAKFRVYKFLERLYKDLNSTNDIELNSTNDELSIETVNESIENVSKDFAFIPVHILDKTGYLTKLLNDGHTREDYYKIVGKIIGKSASQVKRQQLRLGKPNKLSPDALKIIEKLNRDFNL